MKVCLIRPPKLLIEGAVPVSPIAPLGMALVAAAVKQAGHSVSAIDAFAENANQLNYEEIPYNSSKMPPGYRLVSMGISFEQIRDLIPEDTDVIGISSMFTINWPLDRAMINYLARHFPRAVFIGGGESMSGMAETCLKQVKALTACIRGEGEETIVDFLHALESGNNLASVNGIVYKKDGQAFTTPPRTRIKSIDDIPVPWWEVFPVDKYQRHAVKDGETPRKTLPVLGTRGCPYQCTFCTSPAMWGTRYYMREPLKVVEEIEGLHNKFGITNFEFYDLTAIIKKEWIIEFSKLLMARNLDITWRIPAGTRSEAIDEEVAQHLYASGCYFLSYAPESGSPRLLKLIKKKVSLPNLLKSISHSRKQNMTVSLNMIMALPDETHRDIWNTIWFLLQCSWRGVKEFELASYRPYPGSELFNRLQMEGKVEIETDDYIIESLFNTEMTETLKEQSYYNQNVHRLWYKVYYIAYYMALYGAGYVFRPSSFIRAISNVKNNRHETRVEKGAIISLRWLKDSFLKPALRIFS